MIHFLFLCFFTRQTLEMNGDESCCPLKRQEISMLRHDWVFLSTVCTCVTYGNNKKKTTIKWRTDSKTCLYRSPPSVSSSLQHVQGSFRVLAAAAAAAAQLSAVRQVNHGAVTLEHEPESWCKFTRNQFFHMLIFVTYFNSHFLFQSPTSTCVFTDLSVSLCIPCKFYIFPAIIISWKSKEWKHCFILLQPRLCSSLLC